MRTPLAAKILLPVGLPLIAVALAGCTQFAPRIDNVNQGLINVELLNNTIANNAQNNENNNSSSKTNETEKKTTKTTNDEKTEATDNATKDNNEPVDSGNSTIPGTNNGFPVQ